MKTKSITIEEVKNLIRAYEVRKYHAQFKDFAEKYYGTDSHKVVVSVGSEYNDSTYDYQIVDITVYNKKGSKMEPDPSLPAVKMLFEDSSWWNEVTDKDDIRNAVYDLICSLPVPNGRNNHPDNSFKEKYVYIVDEPPVKMPRLLLVEEE